MANTYGRFEEGEPINIQKLNDLVDAVNSSAAKVDGLFKTAGGLQSSLETAKLTITETGGIQIPITKGVGAVRINPVMDKAYNPRVFVSPSMQLTSSGDSGVAVSASGSYPAITLHGVTSSTYSGSVWVNWLVVGHKDITS